MTSNDNSFSENAKSTVFLLTQPPNSVRAKLCIQLARRSKNAILYLVGDGVFNLLNSSVGVLLPDRIYACKEDMDARGVQPVDTGIMLVDFYEQLVADMMVRSDKVYAF
jgi:tRNA 2-thiouridine synthesizing protein B